MNEITGMVIGAVVALSGLLYVTYDNLEYKGYPNNKSCTGECYEAYVKEHGTVVDQLLAKRAEAQEDPFSAIRGLWAGCAACHGQSGEGMGAFPRLSGRDASYISDKLLAYKNKETIGPMSQTMWGQAGMLTQQQIDLISEFVEVELSE